MQRFPEYLKHGSGVMLTLDPTRLLLAFKEETKQDAIRPRLLRYGLVLEDDADDAKMKESRPMEKINHTKKRIWIRSKNGEPLDTKDFSAIEKVFQGVLDWIGPVYRFPNTPSRRGLLCPLPNVLLIKPRDSERKPAVLYRRLAQFGLKDVKDKSKYLGGYFFFVLEKETEYNAYQLQQLLLEKYKDLIKEAHFENMPMIVPIAVQPNDPIYPQQWNMDIIGAGGPGNTGWDINTGSANIVVCVLDEGCDLTHPDLQFFSHGVNLDTMGGNGGPTGPHGTACAGIVAATFNNSIGVAGVAGNCQIMPVAFENWTDVEVAAGINYAVNNGANVISMSFGWNPWNHAIIDPAINNAFVNGVIMCVATHNYNGSITYPATNPQVIACGASDQVDNRKSPTSPDGECWGSDFGPEISVVAPGVLCPTTDIQGNGGYNDNNGGPKNWACVNYPNCGDAAGDYIFIFDGTSAATPHVAGLAALLLSQYPTLTNVDARNIIERTAEKVGTVAYAETPGYSNGTWNQEMGYGRINVLRALDYADVMIKDYPGDTGAEPSTPPGYNYWDFSDIVIRPIDDNVFVPSDPDQSSRVQKGQTNYLYIEATNNGPREAHNVVVTARLTAFVGTSFIYPADWTLIDSTHINPTPVTASFAAIPPGGTVRAKFTISSTQVDSAWGWKHNMGWSPCLLAAVNGDNDYAFLSASFTPIGLVRRYNNLAQRNLSVIDVAAGASVAFPFIAGNRQDASRFMELVINRRELPKGIQLLLSLDDDSEAFPLVNFSLPNHVIRRHRSNILFMERTKIETTIGCCRGILTLEKGSRFDLIPVKTEKVEVRGGEVILKNDKRFVEVRDMTASIKIEKEPNQIYPFSLHTSIPIDAERKQRFKLTVMQRNEKEETIGGASVVYRVK